jgi:hypothetical protein
MAAIALLIIVLPESKGAEMKMTEQPKTPGVLFV